MQKTYRSRNVAISSTVMRALMTAFYGCGAKYLTNDNTTKIMTFVISGMNSTKNESSLPSYIYICASTCPPSINFDAL